MRGFLERNMKFAGSQMLAQCHMAFVSILFALTLGR